MKYFVDKDSIVREIWSKGDTILFIFAGSAAEFALNKAVDWLYFTGTLPADPLGRLFSTVSYARKIIFAERQEALKAIDQIKAIHHTVENNRGAQIPDWAYRDVLFMLIDYSIRSFELLERQLSDEEKEVTFQTFHQLGEHMCIPGLPNNYSEWLMMRENHLKEHLISSKFTLDLYKQYRKHLGPVRFRILKQGQLLVLPNKVKTLLALKDITLLRPMVPLYKLSRLLGLNGVIKNVLLPDEYKKQVADLDIIT